jgi:hypothetical protein
MVGQSSEALAGPFNFGPGTDANRTVQELVETLLQHCGGTWIDGSELGAPHESGRLQLNAERAAAMLGWRSVWVFERVVLETATWYVDTLRSENSEVFRRRLQDQIEAYTDDAAKASVAWATSVRSVQGELPGA